MEIWHIKSAWRLKIVQLKESFWYGFSICLDGAVVIPLSLKFGDLVSGFNLDFFPYENPQNIVCQDVLFIHVSLFFRWVIEYSYSFLSSVIKWWVIYIFFQLNIVILTEWHWAFFFADHIALVGYRNHEQLYHDSCLSYGLSY